MSAERAILAVELALGAAAAGVFAVLHARTKWWRRPRAARGEATHKISVQLTVMALASGGELATLLAIVAGWHPPLWLLLAGYALIDIVMIRWVVLLVRTRHEMGDNP